MPAFNGYHDADAGPQRVERGRVGLETGGFLWAMLDRDVDHQQCGRRSVERGRRVLRSGTQRALAGADSWRESRGNANGVCRLNLSSECQGSFGQSVTVAQWEGDLFSSSFGSDEYLPPQCCFPPSDRVQLEVNIWNGAPIPNSIPPFGPGSCPENTPGECCPHGDSSGNGGDGWRASGGGGLGGKSGGSLPGFVFGGRHGGGAGEVSQRCCPPPSEGAGQGRIPSCGGGFSAGGTCPPAMFSVAPVRYATGELLISATDIESDGFGGPWGHTRSFMNRLSRGETIGQGFNWHVAQWPYLVHKEDVVVVLGEGSGAYWFDRVDDTFVARFGVRRTLELDAAGTAIPLPYAGRELSGV